MSKNIADKQLAYHQKVSFFQLYYFAQNEAISLTFMLEICTLWLFAVTIWLRDKGKV